MNAPVLDRRGLLVGGGSLVLGFAIAPALAQSTTPNPTDNQAASPQGAPAVKPVPLPGALSINPMLDGWIRIDADGSITVLTGKAELGQGTKTAMRQIAAEQLNVDPHRINLITADTALTTNEGFTAGSNTIKESGTAIFNAAAQVRALLVGFAAETWGVDAASLVARDGAVTASDGRRATYGDLVKGRSLSLRAQPVSDLQDPAKYSVLNTSVPRVDIPNKVAGGAAYVQDMRPPGMVHARIVRPPSYGATLTSVDSSAVEKMPGVLKVVRSRNFLAVIAESQYGAIVAMRSLAKAAKWDEKPTIPLDTFGKLRELPSKDTVILDVKQPSAPVAKTVKAAFSRAYQMHGSIGPSCGLAVYQDGALTVWNHSQGMFPLRDAIADVTGLPKDKVRCIHTEGSGCYGHNGADDAGADAGFLAMQIPGRPVRVQWMREQEHTWEPYGAAMLIDISAGLSAEGKLVDYNYTVRSHPHGTRPGGGGSVLVGQHSEKELKLPAPTAGPQPDGSGDRNAIPLYHIPSAHIVHQFVPEMPVRVSSLRGLGAYANVCATEIFMDECAAAVGQDPVAFRIAHMEDSHGVDVMKLAAEKFGWDPNWKPSGGKGRGFGFARYKNQATYFAIAMEVQVDRETGHVQVGRVVGASDSGQVVSPDGIKNQIEGGIIQSISWTLMESVSFDNTRITSADWSMYPIVRFSDVPSSIELHIINRPGDHFLGAGECSQGPTGGALANAIANATGLRMRDLPITRERLKAAIGV